jgi:hypothetical protein
VNVLNQYFNQIIFNFFSNLNNFLFVVIFCLLWICKIHKTFFYISIFVCLSLSLSLSITLSFCLSVPLSFLHLSIWVYVFLSFSVSVFLSEFLSFCLSVCLSVFLSVCLSVFLSVFLSFSTSVSSYFYFLSPVTLSFSLLSFSLLLPLSVFLFLMFTMFTIQKESIQFKITCWSITKAFSVCLFSFSFPTVLLLNFSYFCLSVCFIYLSVQVMVFFSVCLFVSFICLCNLCFSSLLSVLFTVIPQRNNLMNVQLVYETVNCTFKNKQRMKERQRLRQRDRKI